jgi:DNA polymerase (family X)
MVPDSTRGFVTKGGKLSVRPVLTQELGGELRNGEIVRALETIATLMEIKGEAYYRVLGYQRAAESVGSLGRPVSEVEDLRVLPHVGGTIAEVIRDLAEDRTPPVLADLLAEIPSGLVEMTRLPGVGPRTVHTLWKELGVESVEELAELEEGQISSLKGFGKKSAEKILRAAKTYNAQERRMLLDSATALGEQMLAFVRSHPSTVRAEVAGSLRRKKETIGDLDIVAASTDQRALADAFAGAPFADEVLAHGPKKVFIVCGGVEIDLRIVEPEAFGSLLHHFTGGQAHNIALRERAVKMGINISEYGLAREGTGNYEPVATEEELYGRLGLPYIPPELREDTGEIEAAERGELPDLIEVEDIKGDLHVHTNWSDGKGTIESMAEAAIALGYEYLIFCDHSQSLRVANGLSPERLMAKIEAVRKADERYDEIQLLCGSEVDILKDGTLDYEDVLLAELDFVVASVHTSFNVGEKAMTERIIRAMNNPHVRTIGHPTGRLLNRRDPYEVDVSRVIREAAATNTALEHNAYVDRLDLSVPYMREAVNAGVRITIDTDAHDETALSFAKFGVSQARRAWVEKESVLNCLPWDEFEGYLRSGK